MEQFPEEMRDASVELCAGYGKSEEPLIIRCVFLLTACLVLAASAWSGHTLTAQEQQVLKNWLARYPDYRLATDEDCECAEDIKQTRAGYGGAWKPVPDYHPYIATGDFNGDGVEDFAVVVINPSKKEKNFALVVFNGPFKSGATLPAFMQSGLDLKYTGLSYGPPSPKPYRLLLGRFESDSGSLLVPHGRGYVVR